MPPISHSVRHGLLTLAVTAILGLSGHAFGAPLQDAQQFLKQGQYGQALDQVDKHLSDKPKDPQGRFLRGVILTEMGRTNEAISVFTRLTEEFPELPEPYNNLAVIYAQQKQYDKAKQALEKAIRTNPSYATAHENLGDIYARLASQAYDKALQLDSTNAGGQTQTKLAVLRDLFSVSSRSGASAPARTGPTIVAAAPVAAAPVAPPPVVAKPAPPTAPAPAAVPAPTPAAKPAPTAVAAAPQPAAKPAPATTPAKTTAPDPSADVRKMVDAWAADWSKKDVKAYLSHYAKDFKTPGGVSRSNWENERNQRIKKPGTIHVSVEDLKVVPDGADKVVAHFKQQYTSANLKSGGAKTLVLVKQGGRWMIQQERIGG